MNEQIKYQKNLMEYALLVLQQMEFAKSLGASPVRMEESIIGIELTNKILAL